MFEDEELVECPIHFISIFRSQCEECFEKYTHTDCPFFESISSKVLSLEPDFEEDEEEEDEEDDFEF